MPAWVSILPPFLAIIIAVWKKEVVLALAVGIWLAEALLAAGQGLSAGHGMDPLQLLAYAGQGVTGTLERCVHVFSSEGDTRVLIFGLLVGSLLELMQSSGGVHAFVRRISARGWTNTSRKASALPSVLGSVINVDTSLSILASGVVARNLFDKYEMSRERLAFLVDSTCAPISVLLLFNGWGAYVLGLLNDYQLENPVATLAGSVPFNLYALLILALVWYTVITGRVHGPMKYSETKTNQEPELQPTSRDGKARYMIVPFLTLIFGMIGFMFLTGNGDFFEGSGSKSVLWSVAVSTVLIILLLAKDKVFSYKEMVDLSFVGAGKLLPVVSIMLLSFAIGAACKALGTGPFVAGAVGPFLPVFLVAPLLFIAGAVISFTTGTSWGTFAILIPVGIPLGIDMGLPPSFVLAAILGGGVFGDHCSPISDTTLLSSLASGCDHLSHVKTQLPYALTAGLFTILLYMVLGLVL